MKKLVNAIWRRPDVAIIHEFQRPPYGGGNQFLLALRGEFRRLGLKVEANRISPSSQACLFNSFNFDFDRLRRMRRPGCRMVHRVDGPIAAYRGQDDGTDRRIWELNQELADVTVFQSAYSLQAHQQAGLNLRNPTVIMNAPDPAIFRPGSTVRSLTGRKVRLISTSWSDNVNKGAATYQWLDRHLDWSRLEYDFVGRVPVDLQNIRVIPPVPSHELAELLRDHDVYVTASLHDPCSNALLEALACGLPAIYAKSGGHPEIAGEAGFSFSSEEEIPELIDRLVREYGDRRQKISIPSLGDVADRYLSAMGFHAQRSST